MLKLVICWITSIRYLAVVAGLCTEADAIFIPEDPANIDWKKRICEQLKQARRTKKRKENLKI